MKVLKELGLQELIKNIKVGLNSKEPTISKKSGFNLTKTDAVENDTNKLFTGKGAFDLKTVITNAYTSLVSSNVSTLNTSIATKTPHGGYSGSAQQLKNEIDSKLPNVGYGGVHELGRYLDLHLSGSTADYDTRLGVNTDKSLLLQNANGNLEIGPKNTSHCHIYTDRPNFYFNKELVVNGNQVYHAGYKPSKADVGLGSVNNWGASSSIGANSTTEYATTNMVAQVRGEKANAKYHNGPLLMKTADYFSDGTLRDLSYSGFYRTNGNDSLSALMIHCAHSGGKAHGGSIGFDYASFNTYRHAFDSSGNHMGRHTFWGAWNFDPNTKMNTAGGSFTGNIRCTDGGVTIDKYGGGGGLYSGTGDGASSTVANVQLRSWFGIGFSPSISGQAVPQNQNAVYIDVRNGHLTARGNISAGAVYNAVWNDYAELFEKDTSQEYEAGDIISLKFTDDDKEEYHKSGVDCDTNVVGVYSDYFGHLIGGEQAPEGEDYVEYNLKKFIPLGLAGRVKPKIIGKVSKGDFVVTSSIPGVGRKYIKGQDDHLAIFGLVVENKDSEGIARVKVKIK